MDMFKTALVSVVITMTFVMVFLAIIGVSSSNKGIITLPDYPHAVIICGEALTVNHGHYDDPQVKQLIELSKKECK